MKHHPQSKRPIAEAGDRVIVDLDAFDAQPAPSNDTTCEGCFFEGCEYDWKMDCGEFSYGFECGSSKSGFVIWLAREATDDEISACFPGEKKHYIPLSTGNSQQPGEKQ